MKGSGYIILWDVECIFFLYDDCILVIPKDEDAFPKLYSHSDDQYFLVNFKLMGGLSFAYIQRVEYCWMYTLKLIPEYVVQGTHRDLFSGFEITGESIDDFFSPMDYFFDNRVESDTETSFNFLYDKKNADSWTVVFDGEPIHITLSYGDILRDGIASDLKLHAKLLVTFDVTTDTQLVYQIYSLIIRFIKLIRYNGACGKFRTQLFYSVNGRISFNGYLRDFSLNTGDFYPSRYKVKYVNYRPYIERFLKFASSNSKYLFHHYPIAGIRFMGMHYSSADYLNIFSAFEAECRANSTVYEAADTRRIDDVKKFIFDQLNEVDVKCLEKDEKEFLNGVKESVASRGKKFGQKRKIINAYQVLSPILDSSIENIFYMPEFELKGHMKDDEINKVAGYLTELRGAVAHGGFNGELSDLDAQKIHFLEILTYAQTLQRVGLEDKEIEQVIGAVFGCNNDMMIE